MPWPSWAPLPTLVARAGAQPIEAARGPLRRAAGRPPRRAPSCCARPTTRRATSSTAAELRAFAEGLRPEVSVLVDEALVELAAPDASVAPLLDELPNLLVFRSFSKAWSLAGLRVGYVLGSSSDVELLGVLSPGQGVASPAQAAVAAALEDDGRARAAAAAAPDGGGRPSARGWRPRCATRRSPSRSPRRTRSGCAARA